MSILYTGTKESVSVVCLDHLSVCFSPSTVRSVCQLLSTLTQRNQFSVVYLSDRLSVCLSLSIHPSSLFVSYFVHLHGWISSLSSVVWPSVCLTLSFHPPVRSVCQCITLEYLGLLKQETPLFFGTLLLWSWLDLNSGHTSSARTSVRNTNNYTAVFHFMSLHSCIRYLLLLFPVWFLGVE